MKYVLNKQNIFDGKNKSVPVHNLSYFIYKYASKKTVEDKVHFFNGAMTWQTRMAEMFTESRQLSIIDASWIKAIGAALTEARVDIMPGTHTNGKLTLTSFIRLTIPQERTTANYFEERAVPRLRQERQQPGRIVMRRLFGVDLPLTEMPPIYASGLAQAVSSRRPEDVLKNRTISLLIGDLSIADPFVRLLITLTHILSNHTHAAHAPNGFQNKTWNWRPISNQGLWIAAFLINGMAHARGEVLRSQPSNQVVTVKDLEGRIGNAHQIEH